MSQSKKFVYIIKCGGYFKIGVASDLPRRLSSIRCSNPFPIALYGARITSKPKKIESEIHRRLNKYHIHGEWFKVPKEELHSLMVEFRFEKRDIFSQEIESPYLDGQKDLAKQIRQLLEGID